MKKREFSISVIYIVTTIITVTTVLFPVLFWTYSDIKEESKNNISKYFFQTKSVVEVVVENRINAMQNSLNLLSKFELKDGSLKIDDLDMENIDILFFKFNNQKFQNHSSAFIYDTDRIIEKIIENDFLEKRFIINLNIDNEDISFLYTYKKIINPNSGKVEGIIAAAEILNNNLSFLNTILKKTSIKSVSLIYNNNIIASSTLRGSPEFNILKNIDKNGLTEKEGLIFYRNNLNCSKECKQLDLVFTTDNNSLEALYDSFILKSLIITLFFISIAFSGFLLIKKGLIKPIYKFIDLKNRRFKDQTFIRELNVIAQRLNKAMISLNEYKKAVDVSSIVSKGDIEGNITYVNKRFCTVTGYKVKELIGKPHSLLRDPDVPNAVFKDMWKRIKDDKKPWSGYLSNKKKNGEIFYIKLTITPILDEHNNIVEFLSLRENITELVESKKTLENIYIIDKLTGLYNRYKLTMNLKETKGLNLLLLNIDRFSQINDFYGNKIGDELLIHFSKRVVEYFGPKAFSIHRVYGDEFAVTFDNLNIDDILFVTDIFVKEVGNIPFYIDDLKISVGVTSGVSSYKRDSTFINADLALKAAKRDKKDCVVFNENNPILKEHANNLEWTNKIKEALAQDRIVPFFQPIRNNQTKKIEKYECLVRLIEKDGKVISPFFFLDIAKKSKLYDQITRVVVKKSFEYFKDKDYEFSINLTMDDILNKETVEFLKTNVQKFDIANKLVLEIVESEQIEKFEEISSFIEKFKSYGCKVAIDDFGTGYSNFEYLIKLKVDYIKIDGSLIKNLNEDQNIQSVVETIVNFSQKSNMKVIAEFISSKEIQSKIEEFNIEYSQGYHYGEPKDVVI